MRHAFHQLPALANGIFRAAHRLTALPGRKSKHRQRWPLLPMADGLPAEQITAK